MVGPVLWGARRSSWPQKKTPGLPLLSNKSCMDGWMDIMLCIKSKALSWKIWKLVVVGRDDECLMEIMG